MSVAIPWEAECRATAAAAGLAVERAEVGAQNVVLTAGKVVMRFPVRARDAQRVEELAQRHRRARKLGMRAPRLLDWQHGPPGTAHLLLERVPGEPLSQALAHVSVAAGRAALDLVVAELRRLREVTPGEWPFPGQDWTELWAQLPERLERRSSALPPADLSRWRSAAHQAARVAASAPLGLMHGDLQDTNLRLDTDGPRLAVLDWDTALIGDPATDTAAVLHTVGPERARALVDSEPQLAEDMSRFAAYRETWDLQHALWRAGDEHWLSAPS